MKKSVEVFFSQLNKEEINILTSVVAETLATNIVIQKEKIFTAADLWNIHRAVRSKSKRNFL